MFDNLGTANGQNLPGSGTRSPLGAQPPVAPARPESLGQVEDMFSGSEPREKPEIFQPRNMVRLSSSYQTTEPVNPPGSNASDKSKTMVLVLMGGFLLLVLLAAFYLYRLFFAVATPPQIQPADEAANNQASTPLESGSPKENPAAAALPEAKSSDEQQENADSDGDGLSDTEEYRLGTNKEDPDSDGDGLFDREEAKVYRTDPLNTDSDKDGYADGIEVKGGYNPNGQGQLFKQ